MTLRLLVCFLGGIMSWTGPAVSFDGAWMDIKGDHFIVHYQSEKDFSLARDMLRKSEEYYRRISRQIGYSRYTKFWTWDERVKIYVFPSEEDFEKETRQPPWTRGYTISDARLFSTRVIVTYRQQEGFPNGFLPHEISHLILRDYIGFDRYIPVWFDEGLAQLQEIDRREKFFTFMRKIVAVQKHFPMAHLNRMIISEEEDPQQVLIFYAQSLTLIDFLLKEYGGAAFADLCRHLREGKNMQQSMAAAYRSLKSFEDLEERWIKFLDKDYK